MAEGAVHVSRERPGLRQVVEIHLLEELHFAHFLHLRKRLPWFWVEVIRILEATAMIGRDVLLHLRRMFVLLVVRRGDREVSRVVEHIAFLGMDIDLEVRYRERGGLVYRIGHLLDRVFLCFGVVGLEGLLEFDIGIQRVKIRTGRLIAVRDVERHLDLRFLREETSAFKRRTDA